MCFRLCTQCIAWKAGLEGSLKLKPCLSKAWSKQAGPALSGQVLKMSSVGESTTFLRRLFWWLVVPIVKNVPLYPAGIALLVTCAHYPSCDNLANVYFPSIGISVVHALKKAGPCITFFQRKELFFPLEMVTPSQMPRFSCETQQPHWSPRVEDSESVPPADQHCFHTCAFVTKLASALLGGCSPASPCICVAVCRCIF